MAETRCPPTDTEGFAMRRPLAVLILAAATALAGCGDGSENGNSSQNIFTFNNLNDDAGNEDASTGDAGMGDMGIEDAGMSDDMGTGMDMEMDMEVEPPADPTIASVMPASVVEPVDTRNFMVSVTLAEALETDARVEATDLPDGLTANVGSISAGEVSGSLTFTMDNPPATRTQFQMVVTRQEDNMLVGTPAETPVDLAITDVARVDTDVLTTDSILMDGATSVEVSFDQPITGVGPDTVRLFSDIRGLVAGTASGNDTDTVTFTANDAFLPDEQLQLVVTGLTTDYDDPLERPVSVLYTGASQAGTGFGSAVNFPSGVNEVGDVVRFDLEGDGDVDFAVFDTDGDGSPTSQICVNGGLGNFTCSLFLDGVDVSAAVAGDFNADGRIDLAVANSGSAPIERLCINTNGTVPGIQCNDAGVFTAGFAEELDALDVNLDGRLDLLGTPASANPGGASGERLQACINNGGTPPQFTCTESSVTRSIIPGHHGIYDFDGDGSIDVLRSSIDPARVEVCSLSGDRIYDCDVVGSAPILTGDVAANTGLQTFVLYGTETASQKFDVSFDNMDNIVFSASAVPGLSGLFSSLYLTDYTGDSQQDGVAIQPDGTTYACLNGGGSPPSLTCSTIATGIPVATSANGVTGDFDGDGIIDVVVVGNTGAAIVPGQ